MLERDRWWNAREALVCQKDFGIYSPDNLQILLDEQYKTQVALKRLGVSLNTQPSKIPLINALVLPQGIVDMKHPLTYSSIGMPRAGKSSSFKHFKRNSLEGYELDTFGERAGEVKNKLDRAFQFNFEAQLLWQRSLQYQDYLEALNQEDIKGNRLPAFDRDWTDISMTRANVLFGRLDPNNDNARMSLHSVKEELDKINKAQNLIILLLISPKESLRREGPRDSPGRIMNLPFLQVLYEQYIRFHYEMLFYNKVYGQKRPFFYACLDGSGDPYSTYRMIEKTIFWLAMATSERHPPQYIDIY